MQAWATGGHLLTDAADWLYLNAQTSIVIGALIYLYRFRNGSFYFVRNTLIISWGIALIGYFVFPTAPPRLLPEWGSWIPSRTSRTSTSRPARWSR